jgi:hypothetical protein
MPVYDYPPPEYIEVSQLPKYLGMSKQNLYQSGLMEWIKEKHSIYTIGRSLVIGVQFAQEIYDYLAWRAGQIKRAELPSNFPVISDEGFAVYRQFVNDWYAEVEED